MSIHNKKLLKRLKPESAGLVAAAKGEGTAAMATNDMMQEELDFGQMLIANFEVGKSYWIETPVWVYIGKCVGKGLDYIVLDSSIRILVDGRHTQMMENGIEGIEGMQLEITGDKDFKRIFMNNDYIMAMCEWVHKIPTKPI